MTGSDAGSPLPIAWAGPLKTGSAIGRVGVRVAEALAERGHEVELIATDHEPVDAAGRIASGLPVHHWTEVDLAGLAHAYRAVVVNVGDHFFNHGGIFPLLGHAPCLAVMHDFYLGNLFNGWLWWNGSRPGARESEVAATYGAGAASWLARQQAGVLPLEVEAEHLPMTEWVARRAAGCLAHAGFYVPRLLSACAGPVEVAGLPMSPRPIAPLAERANDRLRVVTVGVMNANKCVDRVVEAIAGSPALRARTEYRLVGPIAPEEASRLRARAAAGGWRGLRIDGPASEAELDAALEAADVVTCLRRPVLEGASASLVEALLAGRPTVIADAGCYADTPDDAAVKVPADVPVPALRAALERLAEDEPERRALGARARAYAEARFSLEQYLDVLEPLMAATARAGPVLRMSRGLGAGLAALGLGRDDPAVARIAATLAPVFTPAQAPATRPPNTDAA